MLAGLFVLFARSENIERPFVVGALTMSSSLIAMIMLDHLRRIDYRFHFTDLLGVCVVASLGFLIGRILDRLLGPKMGLLGSGEGPDADLAD
jgi:hypothetical protein